MPSPLATDTSVQRLIKAIRMVWRTYFRKVVFWQKGGARIAQRAFSKLGAGPPPPRSRPTHVSRDLHTPTATSRQALDHPAPTSRPSPTPPLTTTPEDPVDSRLTRPAPTPGADADQAPARPPGGHAGRTRPQPLDETGPLPEADADRAAPLSPRDGRPGRSGRQPLDEIGTPHRSGCGPGARPCPREGHPQ
ncbi:hypothetical protein GCM10009837_18920 [Streptomyces durmitorensis]